MTRIMAILIALLLVQVAWAQEAADEGGSDAKAPKVDRHYSTYVANNYGFKVDLPDSGTISDPSSDGWDKEQQVAFQWVGGADDPVRMIQGRVDSFGKELDEDSFNMFCSALLQNWSSDEKFFTVTTANKPTRFGDNVWNLIEVEDRSNVTKASADEGGGTKGQTVYYSVFSTYAGDKIYTITLYYLEPLGDEVKDLGEPIMRSFAATG